MKDINEYYGSKIHGKKVAEGTDILDERKKTPEIGKKMPFSRNFAPLRRKIEDL